MPDRGGDDASDMLRGRTPTSSRCLTERTTGVPCSYPNVMEPVLPAWGVSVPRTFPLGTVLSVLLRPGVAHCR